MTRTKRALLIPALCGCVALLTVFSLDGTLGRLISVAVFIAALFLSRAMLDRREAYSPRKIQVSVLSAALAVISVSCYFLSGTIFGFLRVVLLAELVLTELAPLLLIVIVTENLRVRLLAQNDRALNVASYLAFVMVDACLLSSGFVAPMHFASAFKVIGAVVFPAITANILYHYVSKRYGALPNLSYRVLILSYPYFIPLHPQAPEALVAVWRMIVPLCVLWILCRLYQPRRRSVKRAGARVGTAVSALVFVFCTVVVLLVSGVTRYRLIIIGSDSMSGAMNKGDAIIYEKNDGLIISEGQIVLFERNGALIVHRVTDIHTVNGEKRYYTKGDANDTADVGYITHEQIVGVSRVTLRSLGYPVVWARFL